MMDGPFSEYPIVLQCFLRMQKLSLFCEYPIVFHGFVRSNNLTGTPIHNQLNGILTEAHMVSFGKCNW